MEITKVKENLIASELKGNTLRVYWYMLKSLKKFVGPREVQRKLSFSSPALAVYHLDKLVELGLVEKAMGEYRLTKVVDVGILKQFINFGGLIIPRNVLYLAMFTTLLLFYITQFREFNFYSIIALIFGVLATTTSFYETIKTWRNRPF